MNELHPESGVRVRLDLSSSDETSAQYDVTLFFADAISARGTSHVPVQGSADLSGFGEVPAYALTAARAFLRQTQGAHRSSGRWPRRVLRWRAER